MEVMFDRVAGLDVGKETVTVCVRTPGPRGGRRSETRTFKTMFGSLRVMRDWLVEAGVSIAAMESTVDVLEAAGAPRGAVKSSGGERTLPPGSRSCPVKLRAARPGERWGGWEQP